MSLFGALNTAVSGLNAQSAAFGNIGDNVANSQTVGFKRTDTNFIDYITSSSQSLNQPGAVIARPDYVNSVQGALTQTDNPLDLAISGQGFFTVYRPTGESGAASTAINPTPLYTRAGNFSLNREGYLVNGSGDYLAGWVGGNKDNVVPIRIDRQDYTSTDANGIDTTGSYKGVSLKENGDVSVSYDNGTTQVVAQIPVTTFVSPDALHRENGQAFRMTEESGMGTSQAAGQKDAGALVTSAVESSNVDIAGEFTKLIVAQRAYSANTKIVTTADELLQQTLDIKR